MRAPRARRSARRVRCRVRRAGPLRRSVADGWPSLTHVSAGLTGAAGALDHAVSAATIRRPPRVPTARCQLRRQPASTSTQGSARSRRCGRSPRRPAGPRCWAASAGSPGCSRCKLGRYSEPVLAASTDGVGTKIAVAQAVDKHDTIGLDLVAMVVDDLVVCGAEPLFLQDYIAVGKVVPEQVATIVTGIAEGCQQAGCALLGGETAEHPGLMEDGSYDLSATGVGIVEADAMLRPERVRPATCCWPWARPGCTPTATRWPATCCSTSRRMPLAGHVEEFGRTLGEELLDPDPDLRPRLPGAGRRDRRAHLRPHHRRRAGPQPRARAAARAGSRGGARHAGRRRRCSS